MQISVQIISMCRYNSKTDNKEKIRIDYICNEEKYLSDKEKFRGYPQITVYLNDHIEENWNLLDVGLVGKPVDLVFEKVPSLTNPTREYNRLKQICTKNGNISIL